jgi:hypothetical protein
MAMASGRAPPLEGDGPIYSPALKANMPIFEAVPHFIEPVDAGKVSPRSLFGGF